MYSFKTKLGGKICSSYVNMRKWYLMSINKTSRLLHSFKAPDGDYFKHFLVDCELNENKVSD